MYATLKCPKSDLALAVIHNTSSSSAMKNSLLRPKSMFLKAQSVHTIKGENCADKQT